MTVVDANGADTNQDFSVTVTEEEPPNRDPVFTSSPPTTATVGVVYTYTATTTDADGDALTLVAELLPDGRDAARRNDHLDAGPGSGRSADVPAERDRR